MLLPAYFEQDGDEDDLRGTDVKFRFYRYLIERHADSQILVIENTPSPEEFADQLAPHDRYGLFPQI